MTPDEARYYAGQSVESDPAELRELLDPLPADPRRLLDVVAGLILDTAFVAPLGVVCPPDAADDVEIRRLPEMLRRILTRGPGSLATARPPGKRFIGACRHYALLACSAFRHHGVPARVRVGFADYFEPGFHDDHWITEYWDGACWRVMDAPDLVGILHYVDSQHRLSTGGRHNVAEIAEQVRTERASSRAPLGQADSGSGGGSRCRRRGMTLVLMSSIERSTLRWSRPPRRVQHSRSVNP
jgi:hypothetical protein